MSRTFRTLRALGPLALPFAWLTPSGAFADEAAELPSVAESMPVEAAPVEAESPDEAAPREASPVEAVAAPVHAHAHAEHAAADGVRPCQHARTEPCEAEGECPPDGACCAGGGCHGGACCAREGCCDEGECSMDGGCRSGGDCASCEGCDDGECACPACADRVALDLYVGLQMISRHLRFVDDVYGAMRRYELPAGPAVTMGGRWFPGAHFTRGVASAFGVDLRFDRSFGITTDRAGLIEYDTVQRVIEISAVGRYVGRRFEVVGGAGYGSHAFELRNGVPTTPDLDATPDTPNVNYRGVRLAVDARYVPFERLGFRFGASATVVADAGGADDVTWFPHADVGGMALSVGVLVPLPQDLELRAGLEYRRYFYAMNAQLGDPIIVGGALDQYTAAELSVAYRH